MLDNGASPYRNRWHIFTKISEPYKNQVQKQCLHLPASFGNQMKKILLLGAGMSASSLIRYLLENSIQFNWELHIVDQNLALAQERIGGHPQGKALSFNALNPEERKPEIAAADLVISMLPPRFHAEIAKDCIELKKHLITPSYITDEMRALNKDAEEAGVLILNEMGVDPGIDHMSAMRIIHEIRSKGGEVTSFKSFCGGLIAPESDNNPWNYKFTWNPRNVVLAGSGGAAKFIQQHEYKYIPYHKLFQRIEPIAIDGHGIFDGYANRDSLSYRSLYHLEDIATFYRGTLRKQGFCEAWNVFVELGMTDDTYPMENATSISPRNYLNAFLPYHPTQRVEDKFKAFLGNSRMHLYTRFEWLGLFEEEQAFGFENATPAQLLQAILMKKWGLEPGDKDMLVMYHAFECRIDGQTKGIRSSMVSIGEDPVYTAMSNTVGLPIAVAAKLILSGNLSMKGVTLPIHPEIYNPILDELTQLGISFTENEFNV